MNRKKTRLYQDAVRWIAMNDETAEQDPNKMMDLISVVMIADIFDVAVEIVAQEVIIERNRVQENIRDENLCPRHP